MENKRLLFLLNLIKEKLAPRYGASICNIISNLATSHIVPYDECTFLKGYIDNKFDEYQLPYYATDLSLINKRLAAYRFKSNKDRMAFLNKLININKL